MTLPKITELEFEESFVPDELPPLGINFLYDFDKGDFVYRDGKLVELYGIESLKMWIMKVMKTERFRFRVYDDTEYGILIEDLIGSNLPRAYIEAEIKREVTSSLVLHPYIDDIQEWTFERDGKWMRVRFRVITPIGAFEQEVTYRVRR